MLPNNIPLLFTALSSPRIASYRGYFTNAASDEEVYGCYQWNESISLSFFKLITLIELVMRNRMHTALSNYYFSTQKKRVNHCGGNQNNWNFVNQSTIGTNFSCNWYEAGVLSNKSLAKVHEKTHNQRNKTPWIGHRRPSADDVVSSLTFGFWSSLIDKNPTIAWASILGDVFPKHRASAPQQWSNGNQQKRVCYRLQLVRDFRNRIAHHEPIWKLPRLLDETPPPTQNTPRDVLAPPTTSPNESISRLRQIYSKHTQLLRWMSQEIYNDYVASTIHQNFMWLCSVDGLQAHIKRSDLLPYSVSQARFKRELNSILRRKETVFLHTQGRNIIATQPIL